MRAPLESSGHAIRACRLAESPLAMIALAGIAVAVYVNTLGYGFALDDFWAFVENPEIRSLRNAGKFFGPGHIIFRPLTQLSWALDYAVAGLRPGWYHAENVLLHALNTVTLYALFQRFGARTAWLAAGLFAVLPVHTEVVANVTSRSELLATLFSLLALLRLARPAQAAALFALALLAKESAIVVPVLALLFWRCPEQPAAAAADEASRAGLAAGAPEPAPAAAGEARVDHKRLLLLLATFAVALLPYLLARRYAYGSFFWPAARYPDENPLNPLLVVDWATRVRTSLMLVGQNLALCVVPYHLSADYSTAQIPLITRWADARFLAWTALPALAGALAVAARKSCPNYTRGFAWFAIAIAPVSNIVFLIGVIRAERLLYVASAGVCLMLAALLEALFGARRRLLIAVAGVLLVVLGTVAVVRNRVWRTHEILVAHTVADAPRSANAHFLLAVVRVRAGGCLAAVPSLRRALELFPRFALARMSLASCLEELGNPDGAVAEYRRLFDSHPDDPARARELVRLCTAQGDWRCVAFTLDRFLQQNPGAARDAGAWLAQGNAWLQIGEMDKAEESYRRSIELGAPAAAHFNFAVLLATRGRYLEASRQYEAAERAGMSSEQLYVEWSRARRSAGDPAGAARIAARGLERFPASATLRQLASGQKH